MVTFERITEEIQVALVFLNFAQLFNQPNANLKRITAWPFVFSRSSDNLLLFHANTVL